MAIVNYPVLDFKNSLAAFHNFAAEYNKDKPLREQLRPQHSKIYARILTLLSRHLYERNKLFNDTPEFRQLEDDKPVMLATNRKAMSWVENTLQVNGNTVYRQVLRLINAGVIMEKINHGSRMNFELLISPEFLLISDLINPDYKPDSKYLQNENKAKQPSLNTSFTPEYLTLEKELFNNSNITVDKESLPAVRDEIVKEPERTEKKNLLKEHGEISQNPDERQSKIDEKSTKLFHEWNQSKSGHSEKGQKLAPEQESKLREHQKGAARWFFWYVLSRLFEERIFNPAHLENTLAYVEQYYFTNCHS
ncbi:MAG: hypothetical protein KAQ75_12955, partial [Bacteroidales bacterium]|nr:hypothetical protein [Bacteroidales bacterium]